MTRVFRGNPRLLLQALPVAVAMIVLKWLYDLSPLRHLELSPLLTGVIAAEVFIVGFILSGTAADFKEAERLPGEVAGSLDSIADECLIMDAELELPEARQCLALLADISGSIRRWLLHNERRRRRAGRASAAQSLLHRVRPKDSGRVHNSLEG